MQKFSRAPKNRALKVENNQYSFKSRPVTPRFTSQNESGKPTQHMVIFSYFEIYI